MLAEAADGSDSGLTLWGFSSGLAVAVGAATGFIALRPDSSSREGAFGAPTEVSLTPPTPDDDEGKLAAEHLASVRRGFELFSNQSTGCIGCHLDYGRQARYLYDAWGGAVRPTDLTEGAFRGGKAPIDLFRCIRGGIGPSGMPAATSLTEPSVWDLVHFVQALPFSRMLPAEVRLRIYPPR
ncbi:MAG: hypothetical protein NVSMB1_23890 [Polyangiales bacterium]